MASLVSDDVVREFAAVGRHDEIAHAISERFGGLTNAIGNITVTYCVAIGYSLQLAPYLLLKRCARWI